MTGRPHGRLPVNVWGDVLLDGGPPVIRRVLTGTDAHECMYAWVYLNEMLTLREMVGTGVPPDVDGLDPADLVGRLNAWRRRTADPQFQITEDLVHAFAPLFLAIEALDPAATEFCELGSTFFAALEKLALVAALAGRRGIPDPLDVVGIERSPFMRRATRLFFPDRPIRFAEAADAWRKVRPYCVHTSRFVASYAMPDTEAWIRFLAPTDVFMATELMSWEGPAFEGWDLGLPVRFFDPHHLVDGLIADGWRLFVSDIHPDHHAAAGRRCFVLRLFGVRDRVADAVMARIGPFPALVGGLRPVLDAAGRSVLPDLVAGLADEARWAEIARHKALYPIWGRAPDRVGPPPPDRVEGLDLRFEGPQIAGAVRDALGPR